MRNPKKEANNREESVRDKVAPSRPPQPPPTPPRGRVAIRMASLHVSLFTLHSPLFTLHSPLFSFHFSLSTFFPPPWGSWRWLEGDFCGLTEPLLWIQLVAERSLSSQRAFGVAMASARRDNVEGSTFQ